MAIQGLDVLVSRRLERDDVALFEITFRGCDTLQAENGWAADDFQRETFNGCGDPWLEAGHAKDGREDGRKGKWAPFAIAKYCKKKMRSIFDMMG